MASAAPVRVPRRSLTASGVRVNSTYATEQYALRLAMPWQQRAIYYCSVIPELSYASRFYARMLEKIRIYPALLDAQGKHTPIESGAPVDLLDRIQDPGGGRSQLQYRYGQFQFVTGECYLFGRNLDGFDAISGEPATERWSMVWREELRFNEVGKVTRMIAPQVPLEKYEFNDSDYVDLSPGSAEAYRMWTPSLRFSGWPTAPMEGVMQMAEELLALSSAVMATATSRLVKSKVWFLPSDMEPPPLDTDGDEDPDLSPLLNDLTQHMTNAIDNPSDPASLAPFIAFVDGELIPQVKDMVLHDTSTDYLEKDLRDEAIKRIAYGLDLPPEVVEGMSGANHWGSWLISEDMWRSHGQPIAEQFCDDLSEMYLRPALRQEGYADWQKVVVAFDASAVIVNPDRSKDADQAIDRGEIGGKGYRIMKNIPEEWAPTEQERRIWLAVKKVILDEDGNPLPSTGGAAGVVPEEQIAQGDQPGPPAGEPGDVSENTNLPASAFSAAAEMALYRCRELAGSRLRSRRDSCKGCMDGVQHVENSLVASALGADGLAELGSPDPAALVAGGADALRSLLVQWGNDQAQADAVCVLIEKHAARTLLQEKPSVSAIAALEIVGGSS